MIAVSSKIIIDLAENFANVGKTVDFCAEYTPDSSLLSYPNAKLTAVKVQLGVTFTNPNVEICGNVICDVEGLCDRCLTPVSKQFVLPIDQVFYKDASVDPDDYLFFGGKLDATKAVDDEIVLSLPSLLLCSDDCKGLCPKCGMNLNLGSCNCDNTRENAFSVLKNLKF